LNSETDLKQKSTMHKVQSTLSVNTLLGE